MRDDDVDDVLQELPQSVVMTNVRAAAGVAAAVDDEETEELPPISRRRMSCRVGAYTAFRWVAPFALSIARSSCRLHGPSSIMPATWNLNQSKSDWMGRN